MLRGFDKGKPLHPASTLRLRTCTACGLRFRPWRSGQLICLRDHGITTNAQVTPQQR